jgi:hypothetical protein
MEMVTWGLMNWKFVTEPFTVTDFVVSKFAVPWWANAVVEPSRKRTIRASETTRAFFI